MNYLIFQGKAPGTITDLSHDGPDVWAIFHPNGNAQRFRESWNFITNEENDDIDPPFPPAYLDDQ